jgi:hypothetical protein
MVVAHRPIIVDVRFGAHRNLRAVLAVDTPDGSGWSPRRNGGARSVLRCHACAVRRRVVRHRTGADARPWRRVLLAALVSAGAWAVVAGAARSWFAQSPTRLSRLGGVGGLVMIGIGARLAVSGRTD